MTHHLRPICARCAYWVEDHTASPGTSGHCHRYPPGIYINPDNGVVVQKFPTTDHLQWCGEWSASDERLTRAMREDICERVRLPPEPARS